MLPVVRIEGIAACPIAASPGERANELPGHRLKPHPVSALSIWPLALSDSLALALTWVFTGEQDGPAVRKHQGGASMPTYVSQSHWTEQGIKNYKDTTSRAQDFSKLVEGSGGRVRELLWTVGEYDIVAVVEFPDDETGTVCLLQVGSLGSVRTSTMRAFSADEMGNIIRRAG
jgi:uncharacterized protein with GYD domain